eukprot:CAMPEP_0204131862 /NCGR_PEP_ID=MMETSP0361-20130328/14191_1 /ASSEMBLY_ACC=CAM_ASM_000343 /TAXON_ID=268821 /ORGANISM="Scrippsiella Hangoei, Strain SHTV-5" /LENGTH=71 /DNA_ID=CAMNT_0051084679 /DNA_START=128 /DNA_END=343 /DNA_ORIENTATION=-
MFNTKNLFCGSRGNVDMHVAQTLPWDGTIPYGTARNGQLPGRSCRNRPNTAMAEVGAHEKSHDALRHPAEA